MGGKLWVYCEYWRGLVTPFYNHKQNYNGPWDKRGY